MKIGITGNRKYTANFVMFVLSQFHVSLLQTICSIWQSIMNAILKQVASGAIYNDLGVFCVTVISLQYSTPFSPNLHCE